MGEAVLSQAAMNLFFRYASAGIVTDDPQGQDMYSMRSSSSWARSDLLWPVKTQGPCGDCWAYAVVGSIETAYSIMANLSLAPVLAVQPLTTAMKAGCSGSTPSQAFQLLLKLARRGGGGQLMITSDWAGRSGNRNGKRRGKVMGRSGMCSPLLKPLAMLLGVPCSNGSGAIKLLILARVSLQLCPPQRGGVSELFIRGFESTSFYGWFGLLLAVQRQPVVVHIEASAPSFKDYDGVSGGLQWLDAMTTMSMGIV
ncbi:unnamed protein product [Closterium sp. Yama58-4]|nr:unnamed protein product [Closterium sp. Yama58-4]